MVFATRVPLTLISIKVAGGFEACAPQVIVRSLPRFTKGSVVGNDKIGPAEE